ncbi:TonB-dependent receptor [Seramator thermalis]|uniref:TonB-dependent receptor n=1 Tax=Seramator thermalis TaxID=2496270 RepID=UPI00101D9FE7|nr:TonB-dependent receptor [Seramator thermalis]
MQKIVALVLLFIAVGFPAFTKENPAIEGLGSLTGRVVDEKGYVLPGATVVIEGTDIGTVSDINGFFRLSGLKDGDYRIQISYIGYTPIERTITISGNRTVSMDNVVLKEGILMQEIVVTGMNAQHKAMSQQKNSINITNVISADQVARFPDSNIGDALKRIPGISVQYDQGEARFAHIRGTSPDLNAVTIDGIRVPSTEAEMRSVQLDLIPADMIQTIEVNKVVTPDMDADAIGGSVNLITKNQPATRRITFLGGSGWNMISEKPTWNLGFSYGDRYLKDKLGMMIALSYQDNPLGSDNAEFEWEKDDNNTVYVSDYQIRQYFVERDRQSYSLSLDYVFNADHKIEFQGIYNRRRDWENRYRFKITDIEPAGSNFTTYEINRELKFGTNNNKSARLEDQRVEKFSLNGDHFFDRLNLKWKLNYSKASEERPNERYLSYRIKDKDEEGLYSFKMDLSNPRTPYASMFNIDENDYENFIFDEFTESYQYTEDRDISGKMDFMLPFNGSGEWKNSIRFGGSYKSKKKSNNEDFYEYSPVDEDAFDALVRGNLKDMTRDNFLAGDYKTGMFPDKEVFGNILLSNSPDYEEEKIIENDFADFDATEDIITGYIRYDQRLYDKVDLLLGLRVEHTASKYNANTWVIDEEGDESIQPVEGKNDSYTNFLPSVIAKWDASDNFKVKAAWTNTLARPKYIDLTPRQMMNFEDGEIEVGNPALKPTKSMNFDLMSEYYVDGGLLSAGIFYKDIRNFIVDERLRDKEMNGMVWDRYIRPINAGDANLFGFEISAQQTLTFLPSFLRYFNIYTNYTYNYSDVKNFNYEGRENEKMRLPGTPEHTFNAALGYDDRRFSARLSYNFASNFIDELGESVFYDRYYDAVNYLDFNVNIKVGRYVNIYANVNNILNQPLRYYQGSKDYTMQMEYYNFRFDAGAKFIF